MNRHTPGPWEAEKWDDPQWVVAHPNGYICITAQGNDEANAKFIVRAVNAHDKLVAALEKILTGFNPSDHGYVRPGSAHMLSIVIDSMRDCAEEALAMTKETQ